MDSKIKQALLRQFEKHRIIFWYDRQRELRADFESLQLEDVEKIELNNNEFSVKYRILREQPNHKFLLYHDGPQPADLDNWLLDVLLAYGEFRTDQVSIWLGQLELGPEYADAVAGHQEFYRSGKRLEALKRLIDSSDSLEMIRLKMLAVCVGTAARLDEVLEGLLAELALEKADAEALIARCNLTDFLWKRVRQDYGYQSATPGVKDFALTLFKSCYAMGIGTEAHLNPASLVLFKRWKDSRQNSEAFRVLSERYAALFRLEDDLGGRDYHMLVDMDMYRLIDQRIISGLVQDVANRTISAQECGDILSQRRSGFWYEEFGDLYLAVGDAAQFISELDGLNLTMTSLLDGVQRYSRQWYVIDQLYRKFIYHVRKSSQHTLMQHLSARIENLYSNNYLLTLNDNWQVFVDQTESWSVPVVLRQRDFFTDRVQPYLDRNNKIFVIVSDALRYEIAEEFVRLIRKEDRYEAEIEPAVTVLPSYTQLGMAALLPHTQLRIDPEKGVGVVYIDGQQDTRGTDNRAKILAKSSRGTAIQAKDFMLMTRDETREFAKAHDVIYLYHNRIDEIGDDRDSEERVFAAAAETLDELVDLVKKLQSNANAYNFLLTADHGFIYQNNELDESDFLGVEPHGERVLSTDRRFVVGWKLQPQSSFKAFTAAQVGLDDNFDLQFPKSINRLRKKGSGSRYVHGGATLQEVVIPVVRINKKRSSDIRRVEVAIVRGINQVITAGQLTIKLYQKEPVSEKVQARTLRVGLYTQDGKLISDTQEIIFDFTAENERDREKSVRLILSRDSQTFNNKNVYVKLLEREVGTSFDIEYESVEYLLRRSFTSDFDF